MNRSFNAPSWVCPRITERHLAPDNFSKMLVKLATQVNILKWIILKISTNVYLLYWHIKFSFIKKY